MKGIRLYPILLLLLLVACENKESGWQDIFSEEEIHFPPTGSEKTLVACTPFNVWTVATDAEWLEVKRTREGVTVSAQENESPKARKAIVQVLVAGEEADRFAVLQDPNSLQITPLTPTVGAVGGTVVITVNSPLGWTYELQEEQPVWLEVNKTETALELGFERNYSFKERPVRLTLSSGNLQANLSITQPASAWYESFQMQEIKGGTFLMGAQAESPDEPGYDFYAYQIESPVHEVTVSTFYMGCFEVTQEQWKAAVGNYPSARAQASAPVESVSWEDVQTFLAALNEATGLAYRLPTEAEWEYAARGGAEALDSYYGGAWDYSSSEAKTHPVGMLAANNLGLYDMRGNVREWCQDWFDFYTEDAQENPSGPDTGDARVTRGGGWTSPQVNCRPTCRDQQKPDTKSADLGFRLALSK